MFCYQCEQTAGGVACTQQGVCGKDAQTAALQDLLVHAAKGIAMYAYRARKVEARDADVDRFVPFALFTTLTNVNFDAADFVGFIGKAAKVRDKARALYEKAFKDAGEKPETLDGPATFEFAADLDALTAQGQQVGIEPRKAALGDDLTGLQELIMYGLKGAGAYAYHAHILGKEDNDVYAGFLQSLNFLTKEGQTVDQHVAGALAVGELNLKCMAILDAANTETYGDPEPTQVRIEPLKGKAILVSGHDLKDLEALLKQTEGKGINVYTHGEMLTANSYPGLKKYSHLAGNYGSAWQNQHREFSDFPGSILMTTNCLLRPQKGYADSLFTCGPAGYPGITHISDGDFTPVIDAALAADGFAEDGPDKTITIGFGHAAVMSVAGKVIEAVKSGAVRHFFLIGGCDGARPGRNYYTELAEAVPDDCIILTLACGKYRFNKLEFGDIGGIPRLLDIGQCNDAYSAIQIAVALAGAFDTDVNSLPLSMILSWYEQKACAILLTLLHLGIKGIRLGPSLPAFVTPTVLQALVDNFNIAPISTPAADLQAILG